jgi:hypothetical protein
MRSVISANAVLLPTVRQVTPDAALISIAVTAAEAKQAPHGFVIDAPDRAVGGWEDQSPEDGVAPLFALPSFTPEFLCRSRPSLDALGVREKSEGKESLRRLASNTPNA